MASPSLHTGTPDVRWPAMPKARSAQVLSLLHQFQQSEFWPRERLEQHQFRQLRELCRHARETVPFHAERFKAAGLLDVRMLDAEAWRRIPLLTRSDVQDQGEALYSAAPPKDHGAVAKTSSSGSTGRPVTVQRTEMLDIFQSALVVRNDLWRKLDVTGCKAIIRSYADPRTAYPDGYLAKGWGSYIDGLFETGTMALLRVATPLAEQAEWLGRIDPDYLTTYPTNLAQLAGYCADNAIALTNLKSVATISEALPDGIHDLVREAWNVPLFDIYSAQEVGMIAAQCPDTRNYHVAAESVFVEILDADNRPCEPGQTGRVVVTSLHNFATPLIRYDLGDFAEAGDSCPCGRGLPVLRRIIGRTRNMMIGPGGQRFRPALGSRRISALAPVRQFQLVQTQHDCVELRLVAARALTPSEKTAVRDLVVSRLGFPVTVTLRYLDDIPRSASGKFEDFICQLPS